MQLDRQSHGSCREVARDQTKMIDAIRESQGSEQVGILESLGFVGSLGGVGVVQGSLRPLWFKVK